MRTTRQIYLDPGKANLLRGQVFEVSHPPTGHAGGQAGAGQRVSPESQQCYSEWALSKRKRTGT